MIITFVTHQQQQQLQQEERRVLTNRSDEGLTLETSAFLLLTVAILHFQLSC